MSLDSKIEELQDTLLSLNNTRDTSGWKMLVDAINSSIRDGRTASFNNRINSLEDAFRECDLKATIAGMQQVILKLDTLIDEADTDLKALIVEREEENA